MRNTVVSMIGLAAVLLVFAGTASGNDAQNDFTYQGKLVLNGTPVTDTCDFIFYVWDSESGGVELASFGTNGVSVIDGLFTVPVIVPDTGLMNGDWRFLEIWVCCLRLRSEPVCRQ